MEYDRIDAKSDICDRSCWCHYCKEAIKKDEHFIEVYKKAIRELIFVVFV
jgi:hypothetical protein